MKSIKVCRVLNDFEHFLIFVSTVSDCLTISAFDTLVGVPLDIASSAVGLKICAITAENRKDRLITKEKKSDHRVLTKLNTIEVLISKALSDSYINHDKFVSVNNVLREFNETKEEIKNPPKCCGIYYIKIMET